jgi:ribonuclease P protein component
LNGRFSYPKLLRLRRPAEFKAIFDAAQFKIGQPQFLMLASPNGLQHPRLGLVIAKKKVRLAVQRNRIKRITRDSFRRQQHELPAVDLLLIARQDLGALDNESLHQALLDAWKRLQRKARQATPQKPDSKGADTGKPVA